MDRVGSWERGRMPDVRLEDREADRELLCEGELGPYIRARARDGDYGLGVMHPALREILIRLDRDEVESLSRGLRILTKLEKVEFDRIGSVLRFVNLVYRIGRIIKWTAAAFMGGLAAMVLAGEQIQKLVGWAAKLIKLIPR